jgi:hypothetical protein
MDSAWQMRCVLQNRSKRAVGLEGVKGRTVRRQAAGKALELVEAKWQGSADGGPRSSSVVS